MNPRKRRRVRRRIRRTVGTLVVATTAIAVAAVTLSVRPAVLPAGASGEQFSADAVDAVADIQDFWAEMLPAVYGKAYSAIPADRVHPYSAADPPPGCGTRGTTPYREVAGNAFYCERGDFVAYDDEQLVPTLRERYGDVAVALVLAHEWGHAIQARVGAPDGAFVYTELQADCFAGAWARRVVNRDGTDLRLSVDDLDRALAGFIDLRDPSGVDGGEQGAHGNAFDRIGALQDGLLDGAERCRGYETDPPAVTEAAFTSYADQAINGDLPLEEVLPMLQDSLDGYWDSTLKAYDGAPRLVASRAAKPTCSGGRGGGSDGGVLSDTVIYCADTNTIVYASATLQDASDEIGDLGAGVFVAAAWASAVQHDLDRPIGSNTARVTAECLTGAWAGAVEQGTAGSRDDSGFAFSPGDLDEVVVAFVATDGAQSKVDRGSVFDRVNLFRTGFEHGPSACLTT